MTDYDVRVKAWKPRKVVTIARFDNLPDARECQASLTEIGFQAIVSYKTEETR
jgi:hypothetical protein